MPLKSFSNSHLGLESWKKVADGEKERILPVQMPDYHQDSEH